MRDLPICYEGQHADGRSAVVRNVFDIPERLKEVDPRFFVMFNHGTQKFEVHVKGQQITTLGCELPFPDLDYRAVQYVREFSGSRTRENAQQVQKHNDKLEQTVIDDTLDKANYKMGNAIRWAENHPSNQMPPKELIAE